MEFINKWKKIPWTEKKCHAKAPENADTATQIEHACTSETDEVTNHCICLVGRAHSCYILCKDNLGEAMSCIKSG